MDINNGSTLSAKVYSRQTLLVAILCVLCIITGDFFHSKLDNIFLEYFDALNYTFIIVIHSFQGDLTNISAVIKTLILTTQVITVIPCKQMYTQAVC